MNATLPAKVATPKRYDWRAYPGWSWSEVDERDAEVVIRIDPQHMELNLEPEYFDGAREHVTILELLDGTLDLRAIVQNFRIRHPDYLPATATGTEWGAEVLRLVKELRKFKLVVPLAPGSELYEVRDQVVQRAENPLWLQAVKNPLFLPIPLFRADTLFHGSWQLIGRWLFSLEAVIFSVCLMIIATLSYFSSYEVLTQRMPGFSKYVQQGMVLELVVAMLLVKSWHELCHGMLLAGYGCTNIRSGLMFILFTPCFYVDAGDVRMVSSRWKRVYVALAGVYGELLLATVAWFLWLFAPTGSSFSNVLLAMVYFAGIHTIVFNLMPLMRIGDGYWLLAFFWRRPKLREQSTGYLQSVVASLLTRDAKWTKDNPLGEAPDRHYLAVYGVLSTIYVWVITWRIVVFIHQLLLGTGFDNLVLLGGIYLLIVRPILSAVKFLRKVMTDTPLRPEDARASASFF